MLQKLVIRNYAIIDHLSLSPDAHLNTVTGETGAGKSIILGALSLILGDRADTSVLIHKEEKCFVEAHFDVKNNLTFRKALQAAELDEEDICIIRREINVSGKSRAFINDTPVNLALLNALTSRLVDLHQQFDHMALESDHFQTDVLDAIAGQVENVKDYHQSYTAFKTNESNLAALRNKQAEWQKEADYKRYLLEELTTANFKENEAEESESQLKMLQHAERIKQVLENGRYSLLDGEMPIIQELKKVAQQLQTITNVLPEAEVLLTRFLSSVEELKDVAAELETLEGKTSLDAGLMDHLQSRLDMAYKLMKKHGLDTTQDLLNLQQQLDQELQETLHLDEKIQQMEQEHEELLTQIKRKASSLTKHRTSAATETAKRVTTLLGLVGMPNAAFSIQVQPEKTPGPKGMDRIAFLLDANKSGKFLPLHKAASGGEMSRIMLSIKSLTAEAVSLPTMIFDEVDTGISGEAARQVAILLKDLAQYHQIICITHQPQVAARGSRHFYVYKDADGEQRITTKIKVLTKDEQVSNIARMIGGEHPSEAALQNAAELVL